MGIRDPLIDKDDRIFDVFEPIEELGRGGQAKVLKVKADRDSEAYSTFLASAIAWHEVNKHKQIAPLRLKIATINRNMTTLMNNEAELMDKGEEEQAARVSADIVSLQNALLGEVDLLKKRQSQYVDQRSSKITQADPEAMIKHMGKIGLPYPEDDIFAMKLVLMDEESLRARMQDEFKSLKLLDHPGILKVYVSGDGYYVEELLTEVIDYEEVVANPDEDNGLFTNLDRLNIVAEVARALEHTHLFGVVHRDVKPENIAVDSRKNVKLIDFGLAKSAETEGVTQTGTAIGTPCFMCLEQIETTKDANPTFDIYGLGASLYTYVAGEMPFLRARNRFTGEIKEPKSGQDILLTVANRNYDPIPPTEIAPGIPDVLQAIILKAMGKEQIERYQSMTEFREDLEKFISLADEESLAAPDYYGIEPVQVDMKVRKRVKRVSRYRTDSKKKKNLKDYIPYAAAAVLLIIIIVFLSSSSGNERAVDDSGKAEQPVDQNVKEMFEYAEEFAQKNPEDYEGIIRNFEAVQNRGGGTVFGMKASDRLDTLREKLSQGKKRVMNALAEKAASHLEHHEYAEASSLYLEYTGEFAAVTRRERTAKAEEIEKKRREYRAQLARAEEEKILKLQAEQKKKERELQAEKDRKEAEVRRLKNQAFPILCRKSVESIRQHEFRSILAEIAFKMRDSTYTGILPDLKKLEKTVRIAEGFYSGIAGYFKNNEGTGITVKKSDGSTETGVIQRLQDGKLFLSKKLTIDGASLETVIKIPLEDISLAGLISICGIRLTDPDTEFTAYVEADIREDQEVMDTLSGSAREHYLFPYLKPASVAFQQVSADTPVEEPAAVEQRTAFTVNRFGALSVDKAGINIVHCGKDNPHGTVPQYSVSIQMDPGFPKKTNRDWEGEGTFTVGAGSFRLKETVKTVNADIIDYSARLTHPTGISTKWMFLAITIPKDVGTGRQITVDGREFTITEKKPLPHGIRTKARTVRMPVGDGELVIRNIPEGVYLSTLTDEYLLQVLMPVPGKDAGVTDTSLSLRLKYFPGAEKKENGNPDSGWIDMLKGTSAADAGWKTEGPFPLELNNGILIKPAYTNTISFWNTMHLEDNAEIEVRFNWQPGQPDDQRWVTFGVWPENHWKGDGVWSVQYIGRLPGTHTLLIRLKDAEFNTFIDGEPYNYNKRNTLAKPPGKGVYFLRMYVPALAVMKILHCRYRELENSSSFR